MNLLAFGINHVTAPLEVREKVAFTPEFLVQALRSAYDDMGVDEVVVLSTCNRTEIYVSGTNDDKRVLEWLANFHSVPSADLESYCYSHSDQEVLRHLMRVASGLDSMILGEPQIFGQLKSAFAMSEEHGVLSGKLHSAFQQVFAIAKRVRTETAIGENPVSVAFAAVALSQRIFADLSECSALLIGAGTTIELVAKHLHEKNINKIVVANRTLPRAQELAESISGEAVLLSDIPEQLQKADIVISSTASQLPILGKGAVEDALKLRKHKPMFMVDIAVPRDIEPQVAELDDVYLYTVDDLMEVVDENKRSREEASKEADELIRLGVEKYLDEARSQNAVSIIKNYRQKAESLRDEELEKAIKIIDKGGDPKEALQLLARNITNKLLHPPTSKIKKASTEGRHDVVNWAQELFDLSEGSFNESSDGTSNSASNNISNNTSNKSSDNKTID